MMAKQETRTNEQQTPESRGLARDPQQQRGILRPGISPFGFGISPTDFFRMNPFSMMRRMTEEMDRMFGEGTSEGGERGRTWAPAIEVQERDGNYVVRADLPGIKPEEVKVEIADDAIVLQGERKSEREEERGGVHLTERRYGRFYREIPLPEGAKTDQARARCENGVVEITVPVEEQRSQRRQIRIEGSSQRQGSEPYGSTPSGRNL
jgi:HSP20 family protein